MDIAVKIVQVPEFYETDFVVFFFLVRISER